MALTWKGKACVTILLAGLFVALVFLIHWYVVATAPPYVTVSLLGARGLDVDDRSSGTPVEFDVAIGVLHLHKSIAVAHDSGEIAISYAGIKLAEGPVPKFYVAGRESKWVEAVRAVVPAGADQAPLSQMFRDHVWVDQQMHGAAEFDIDLTLYNVNITTGQRFYSLHTCKAGLAAHDGEAKPSECGLSTYFIR